MFWFNAMVRLHGERHWTASASVPHPRYHYAEWLFYIAFVRWTERISWLWGTYDGMWKHNMAGRRRFEDVEPTAVLSIVIGKIYTPKKHGS